MNKEFIKSTEEAARGMAQEFFKTSAQVAQFKAIVNGQIFTIRIERKNPRLRTVDQGGSEK